MHHGTTSVRLKRSALSEEQPFLPRCNRRTGRNLLTVLAKVEGKLCGPHAQLLAASPGVPIRAASCAPPEPPVFPSESLEIAPGVRSVARSCTSPYRAQRFLTPTGSSLKMHQQAGYSSPHCPDVGIICGFDDDVKAKFQKAGRDRLHPQARCDMMGKRNPSMM